MKKYLVCFILLVYTALCIGCNSKQKKNDTAQTVRSEQPDSTNVITGKSTLQEEDILSWDYEQAIVELGEPVSRDMFSITEVSKFSIELLNFFPRNSDVQIKELTFETDSIMNLTIWYVEKDQKWQPIHFMKWDKNSQL